MCAVDRLFQMGLGYWMAQIGISKDAIFVGLTICEYWKCIRPFPSPSGPNAQGRRTDVNDVSLRRGHLQMDTGKGC